jgi:NitT/TauT family transport system ATP-binding protein
MSARPGRIIGDYVVPFGAERHQEIRFEPEFAELCGRINDDLKDAHA